MKSRLSEHLRAKIVEFRSQISVTENVIRFRDLVEVELSRLCVDGVHLRMVLAGEVVVGVTDLLVGGAAANLQHLVVIEPIFH